VLGRHFHRLAHQRRIGVGRDLRIDEGVEVYELKESLMWNRLLRKSKCIL